jgi:hypothetical protein
MTEVLESVVHQLRSADPETCLANWGRILVSMLAESSRRMTKPSLVTRPLAGWVWCPELQHYVEGVLGDPGITILGLLALWTRLFLFWPEDMGKSLTVADLKPVRYASGQLALAGPDGVQHDPVRPRPLLGRLLADGI